MKNKHLLFLAVMAFAVVIMTACNKSASVDSSVPAGKQHLSLYLTDGPGLFDKVMIDIRSVKVLVDTCSNTRHHDNDDWDDHGDKEEKNKKEDSCFVWENLNVKAGVYDILKFRNGADTLLAASGITKGSIRLIKIEMGTNNSVVKDSISYPVFLKANSGNFILIKLKGNEFDEYMPGRTRLWLDFDITRSIIQERDNKFYLKPVFHFFTINKTGSIATPPFFPLTQRCIRLFVQLDAAYGSFFRCRYYYIVYSRVCKSV